MTPEGPSGIVALMGFCTVQAKGGINVLDESQREGTTWKQSMNLLSFTGGDVQVPRGRGCLFIELCKGFVYFLLFSSTAKPPLVLFNDEPLSPLYC